MNKNLYNLLCTFSATQWSDFYNFLNSPYFVKSRNYCQIFSILKKYIYEKKTPDALNLNNYRLELSEKINEQSLSNRLSEINKLAEKFIVIDSINEKSISYKSDLYEILIQRRLFSNFIYNYSTVKKQLIPNDTEDFPDYFRVQMCEGYYHRSKGNFKKMFDKYNEQSEYYVVFLLDKTLSIAIDCHFMDKINKSNEFKLFKSFFRTLGIDEIMNKIENKSEDIYKALILRYYLYRFFTNSYDISLHYKVTTFFEENINYFSKSLKTDYYQKMQMQYVYMYNSDICKNIPKFLTLAKSRISDGITMNFSLQQYPASEFRDFVLIGLIGKEYDWVESFINKYYTQLPDSIRDDEFTLAIVNLNIHKRDFLKALHYINNREIGNNYICDVDLLRKKLIIEYELDRINRIKENIELFRNYLRRNGIEEKHRVANKNFLINFNKLLKYKASKQNGAIKTSVDKFIANLSKSADSQWLKNKSLEIFSNIRHPNQDFFFNS